MAAFTAFEYPWLEVVQEMELLKRVLVDVVARLGQVGDGPELLLIHGRRERGRGRSQSDHESEDEFESLDIDSGSMKIETQIEYF